MSEISYLLLELATIVLFALTAWHAAQRGLGRLLELTTASIYGILLEWGNILIFQTYHYSAHFWLAIGPVPIIIGLCWGMIVYGAMAYTDQLGLFGWAAPFADTLWAIMLDLGFDAIAIRLELWTWTIPLSEGYFGVPADNFFAWLWVVSFGGYTRWVRSMSSHVRPLFQLGAPVVAFAGLLGGIGLFNLLAAGLYPEGLAPGSGMVIFVGALLACVGIVALGLRRGLAITYGIDLFPTLVRWAMHGYFLIWALLLALFPALRLPGIDMPLFLILIAFILLGLEVIFLMVVLHPKHIRQRQLIFLPILNKASLYQAQHNQAGDSQNKA
jgi:hypothetical protein